jgi:sulfur carrier protein
VQNIAIIVNGEGQIYHNPLSVQDLLDRMALSGKKIAVERNGEIVPRAAHGATLLADGDRLEIVVAVGGG